jgi:ribosomal protein S12 methylthiotransferase accessory factor
VSGSAAAPPTAPPRRQPPLAQAAAQLAALLGQRARIEPRIPAPVVVPLGGTDTLNAERDPSAGLREHARVHVSPESVLVGPWGGAADRGACGHCLAMRWQRLRGEREREALESGGPVLSSGHWPVALPYLADAVWELYRAVVAGRVVHQFPCDRVVSQIDLRTIRTRTVPIVADPLCPDCPGGPAASGGTVHLVPQPKPSPVSYRTRPPGCYPLLVDGLVNPVCGVLGPRTVKLLESPVTAPVLGRVMKQGHGGLNEMTWSGQANSYRGSRDLALLEGLERYASVEPRRPGGVLNASYEAVRDIALDPLSVGSYAPQTYRTEPLLSPFDPAREIPWVWGYSLTGKRPVLVPLHLAYYSTGSRGENFVFESSNGCASGASLAEAILFGLLELVERDAFLLGWYGGAGLARIDIARGGNAVLRSMLDRARLLGYEVHAFDNRADIDIPVVTSLAVRRDGGDGALAFAAGASLEPDEALMAAVSEVLSHIPSLPGAVRRRGSRLRAMAADFTQVAELSDHAELFALPEMSVHARRYLEPAAARPAAEVYASWQARRPRTTDLLDDLRYCQSQVERAGLEVIVVDQTCAEQRRAGLHSACVIVPGLLPLDFGWSRQRALRMPRLLSAGRRAGWRDTDLTGGDLHLVPHPFS